MMGEYLAGPHTCLVSFEADEDPRDKQLLAYIVNWAREQGARFVEIALGGGRKHQHIVSDRPNDIERLIAEMEPLPVLNCFECQWCHGPVDRHAHVFQCRGCKAIGDLITGIMCPSRPEVGSSDQSRAENPRASVRG